MKYVQPGDPEIYTKSDLGTDPSILGRNRQANVRFINTAYQSNYDFPDKKPEWVQKSGVVSIGSPYSLNRVYDRPKAGHWLDYPSLFIGPFSSGSASTEKNTGNVEGSGGQVVYEIRILEKKLGNIHFHWDTPFDGDEDANCRNYLIFESYEFPSPSVPPSGKPVDPLLLLFGVYAVTRSIEMRKGKDFGWNAFGSTTAGIPGIYGDPTCSEGDVCINTNCEVAGKSGQIWVNFLVQWPNLTGKKFEEALATSGGEKAGQHKILQDLKNCIYINTPVGGEKFGAFYQSFALDFFDSNYSSFSWTLNNTRAWINAPASKAEAISLYARHGFEEASCLDSEIKVALYLEPCEKALTCSTAYKHAALLWHPDKIGWTSKFGEGPLLTHGPLLKGSVDTIINPWNMDPSDVPCLSHYGIPSLCFKGSFKESYPSYMFNETLWVFTQRELTLLSVAVGNVPSNLKESFGSFYKDWIAFTESPHIKLSSSMADRGTGPAFERLVSLGQDSMPLVVEKLTSPSEFKAAVVYEHISGVTGRGDVFMSLQEQAATYAHEWLENYSIAYDL